MNSHHAPEAVLILRHPLWRRTDLVWQEAVSEAQTRTGPESRRYQRTPSGQCGDLLIFWEKRRQLHGKSTRWQALFLTNRLFGGGGRLCASRREPSRAGRPGGRGAGLPALARPPGLTCLFPRPASARSPPAPLSCAVLPRIFPVERAIPFPPPSPSHRPPWRPQSANDPPAPAAVETTNQLVIPRSRTTAKPPDGRAFPVRENGSRPLGGPRPPQTFPTGHPYGTAVPGRAGARDPGPLPPYLCHL